MSRTCKKPNKQLSRSVRLRKYESAYETCLKTLDNKKDKHKKPSEESKDKKVKEKEKDSKKKVKEKEKISKSKDRKRPLNDYQKFVREESKKSKYQGMSSSERMLLISKVWKTKKLK